MEKIIQLIDCLFSWVPNESFWVVIVLIIAGVAMASKGNKYLERIEHKNDLYIFSVILFFVFFYSERFTLYTYGGVPYFLYFLLFWISLDIFQWLYKITECLFDPSKTEKENDKNLSKNGMTLEQYIVSNKFISFLSVSFLVLSVLAFLWSNPLSLFNHNCQVDTGLLGTFGDFIGGVLGTLFAMISLLLVIKTFKQQYIVTQESKNQIELQRFNDLFFQLLKQYKDEVAKINSRPRTSKSSKAKKDKEIGFYQTYIDDIQGKFDFDYLSNIDKTENKFKFYNACYSNLMDKIFQTYMRFFVNNRDLSICFRSLYRIYVLFDEVPDSLDNQKKEYMKIVRAELSTNELFFLKYNAFSYYGENFKKYIFKYNILKHLPKSEFLEFIPYTKHFKETDKELKERLLLGFDIMLDMIRDFIQDEKVGESKKINRLTEESFSISVSKPNEYTLTIQTTIDMDPNVNYHKYYAGCLVQLGPQLTMSLFETFLRDFYSFNENEELKNSLSFPCSIDNPSGDIYVIKNQIVNEKHEGLGLFYDFKKQTINKK